MSVPVGPPAPAAAVLSSAQARAAGLTRWQLRVGFHRVRHDVHIRAELDPDHPDVRIAVAVAALPPRTVLGGWAAARLHERSVSGRQLDVFDGRLPDLRASATLPVLVTGDVGTRVRVTAGIELFRSIVPPEERTVVDGVPVTSATRTAFDLARSWPVVPAVVAVDRLLALGLADVGDVARLLGERRRWRGVPGGRRVVRLADAGSESPRETMLRLLWLAAGFPPPLCNPVVTDERGGFIARVDLLDPEGGVVGEYDGAVHSDAGRRADDARRQEALEDVGLVVVRAAAPDVTTSMGREAWRRRLANAYARAHRSTTRRWRVEVHPSAPTEWCIEAAKPLKWSDVAPPCTTWGMGWGMG